MEEAQEEFRLVERDRLVTQQSAVAFAQENLKEGERGLELLLAGSRQEEVDAVEAELARLNVELAYAQTEKSLTRIMSPSAGIVTTPKLEERVGELVQKGELILEVYDLSSVIAEIAVPEKEMEAVRVGQPVLLRARAFPGRTCHGQVMAIAPVATEGQVQRVVAVRSTIANPDLLLRPGMSGNAKIIAGKRRLGALLTRRLARTVRVDVWSWY